MGVYTFKILLMNKIMTKRDLRVMEQLNCSNDTNRQTDIVKLHLSTSVTNHIISVYFHYYYK